MMEQAAISTMVVASVWELLDAHERWTIDGDRLVGPGSADMILSGHGGSGMLAGSTDAPFVHVDVTFELNRDDPRHTSFSYCVTGFGADATSAIESAVGQVISGPLQIVYELTRQNGQHAHHLSASDPGGIEGFHIIQGHSRGSGRGRPPSGCSNGQLERA